MSTLEQAIYVFNRLQQTKGIGDKMLTMSDVELRRLMESIKERLEKDPKAFINEIDEREVNNIKKEDENKARLIAEEIKRYEIFKKDSSMLPSPFLPFLQTSSQIEQETTMKMIREDPIGTWGKLKERNVLSGTIDEFLKGGDTKANNPVLDNPVFKVLHGADNIVNNTVDTVGNLVEDTAKLSKKLKDISEPGNIEMYLALGVAGVLGFVYITKKIQ